MINKLRNEIKNGMKEKNPIKRDVFKMVLGKAQLLSKESKSEILTDELIIKAGNSEMKQMNQTLDMSPKDSILYKETLEKKRLLEGFLPKLLTENELRPMIEAKLLEMGDDVKNKGLVMKTIMPCFKGKADGKLINSIIMQLIK